MTTPHHPELGDPRRPSSTRPPNRSDERGRPPRAVPRSVRVARWFRPARRSERDRGAGLVEVGATTIFAALVITLIYQSDLGARFNDGVRSMVCAVRGPDCGDETWVDRDRPEEPEQYDWGSGGGDFEDNKNIAMQSARGYNWTDQEWACLDNLWSRQSGWDPGMVDSETGSRGIVGFNPALHGAMPEGFEGSAATQIDWGLDYIRDAHGSPCQAWAYWQSTRTY